ncbi:MAG: class I SAM-dependent methyltransferase [Rhodospirillales bacterium]|nr:class I SAM-dependent methyltransferase [Rhodospirillales bacterium]
MSNQTVRDQYETYPYPERAPGDEAKRLIEGSPSHLLELNHYVFGGRRDFSKPFRALVAGGGTGDGAIMLAQHLADTGGPGEVVYTDLSQASRAIAEARARARGLGNITFHSLAIEDLENAALGPFDYVDCCGVLHHMADPASGLAVLSRILADGGGMGLMVYGELGRTGVYPVQDMLRSISAPDSLPGERIKLAKNLLKQLPETNWLRRNPFLGDHLAGGDAGLYDLLLHSRDRAYRVAEIAELVNRAGLAITALIEPAAYNPDTYLTDPKLKQQLQTLPWLDRAAFAELLAGNLRTHVFYVVRKGRTADAVAPADDLDLAPVLKGGDAAGLAARIKPGAALTATLDGIKVRFAMPPLAQAMIIRMDGVRTLGHIYNELATINPNLDRDEFLAQYRVLYAALNGLGQLYLRQPPP